MSLLRYMLYCGAGAALSSVAATMAAARIERKSVLRPLNASSHWVWGESAGRYSNADFAHTAIGGATNIGAGLFWGALFGAHLHRRRVLPADILRDGIAMGALAGIIDYGILPRRLSPGWELALSNRSVVLSMAAMAVGLVAGGLAARLQEADVARQDRWNVGDA